MERLKTGELPDGTLSAEDTGFFRREGYLLLPGLIEPEYNARLMAEVDEMVRHRAGGDHRMLVTYREMGLLTSHPPAIAAVASLMGGSGFAMHHIHSNRFDEGAPGVGWHQDYEQHPQTNRSHLMVHVFYYLNGLNGEIGDLLILPRSQNLVAQRDLRMLGTADLEGSLCFDHLEPGSAVVVHSAVWHARRPRPGGRDRPRYFIDVSYCRNGVLWPAYHDLARINARALEAGLDRNGRYAFLYDSSQFFDCLALSEPFEELNRGSLVTRLVPPGTE